MEPSAAELRGRLQSLLRGLDDRVLSHAAVEGASHLILTAPPRHAPLLVREILASSLKLEERGRDFLSPKTRVERFKLASLALETHRFRALGGQGGLAWEAVPIIARLCLYEHDASAGRELVGLVGWFSRTIIEHHAETGWIPAHGRRGKEVVVGEAWLSQLLLLPFVHHVQDSKQKTQLLLLCRCLYSALIEFSSDLPYCTVATQDCQQRILQGMRERTISLASGAVFLPLQRMMELIGLNIAADTVRQISGHALYIVISEKGDWGARVLAIQALFVLAATLVEEEAQRIKQAGPSSSKLAGDAYAHPPSEAFQVLIRLKPHIIEALQDARYDRILNVRRIAAEALSEYKNISESMHECGRGAAVSIARGDSSSSSSSDPNVSPPPAKVETLSEVLGEVLGYDLTKQREDMRPGKNVPGAPKSPYGPRRSSKAEANDESNPTVSSRGGQASTRMRGEPPLENPMPAFRKEEQEKHDFVEIYIPGKISPVKELEETTAPLETTTPPPPTTVAREEREEADDVNHAFSPASAIDEADVYETDSDAETPIPVKFTPTPRKVAGTQTNRCGGEEEEGGGLQTAEKPDFADFGKYELDLDSMLHATTAEQAAAIKTLVSTHIRKVEGSYERRGKERLEKLQIQFEETMRRLKTALQRDVSETNRAVDSAIRLEVKAFEKETLPELLKIISKA